MGEISSYSPIIIDNDFGFEEQPRGVMKSEESSKVRVPYVEDFHRNKVFVSTSSKWITAYRVAISVAFALAGFAALCFLISHFHNHVSLQTSPTEEVNSSTGFFNLGVSNTVTLRNRTQGRFLAPCCFPESFLQIGPTKQTGVKWIPASQGNVPEGAFEGGNEGENKVYVIRAKHLGISIPEKLVVPADKVSYISWGGIGHASQHYEVLVLDSRTSVSWKRDTREICHNGIVGGVEKEIKLYIGRIEHDGNLVVGKVHPKYRKLYIPYNGKEVAYDDYAVLVLN